MLTYIGFLSAYLETIILLYNHMHLQRMINTDRKQGLISVGVL